MWLTDQGSCRACRQVDRQKLRINMNLSRTLLQNWMGLLCPLPCLLCSEGLECRVWARSIAVLNTTVSICASPYSSCKQGKPLRLLMLAQPLNISENPLCCCSINQSISLSSPRARCVPGVCCSMHVADARVMHTSSRRHPYSSRGASLNNIPSLCLSVACFELNIKPALRRSMWRSMASYKPAHCA